jgi:hypothetical protein
MKKRKHVSVSDIINIDIAHIYPTMMTEHIRWEGNNKMAVQHYLDRVLKYYKDLLNYPDFLLFHKYCRLLDIKPFKYQSLANFMLIQNKKLYVAYLTALSSGGYGLLYDNIDAHKMED